MAKERMNPMILNWNKDYFSKVRKLKTNTDFTRECSGCGCRFDILKINKPVRFCPYCGQKFGEKNE